LLRRSARDASTARDLAHDFFANLLEGDRLSQVRREGGKFRAYLSGAVKHFAAHRRESALRLRRGGGVEPLSLQAHSALGMGLEDEHILPPDLAFDRAWATTVLARALAALRAECEREGRAAHFERLKPWLTNDAAHGAQMELARDLQLDPSALKAAVHRMKRRFRQCVKAEIAATLSPPADIAEEMRALFAALAQ
jgi:RNA polymerase sigma-70 factor (ECF subfamily)